VIAENIISAQFPSLNSSGSSSVILVVQTNGSSVYSDAIKKALFDLNGSLSKDPSMVNYTGMTSVYSVEYGALNSTVPSFIVGVASVASNVATVNRAVYSLVQNMTELSSGLFQLYQGVNQTSQLVFGIPSAFVEVWKRINDTLPPAMATPALVDQQANSTIYAETGAFGGNQQSIGYYTAFFGYWNASFTEAPKITLLQREAFAVDGAVAQLTGSPLLSNSTRALVSEVATGLNATDWNQSSAMGNLTVNAFYNETSSNLSSLGIKPAQYYGLVLTLFDLGPAPSSAQLIRVVEPLIASGFSAGSFISGSGFSIADLVGNATALGPSPGAQAVWDVAARFFSSGTASAFSGSPLFTVNSTSLYGLLASLNPTSSNGRISSVLNSLIANESVLDYPLTLMKAATRNLVGANNDTMIVMLGFSSLPTNGMVTSLKGEVRNSELAELATTYITGRPVIVKEAEDVFIPALGQTLVPGVVVSVIIVGILFAAPLAAILPLVLGGLSIAIAYATIYLGVIVVGHGKITFLTPTLTTLLMLGLAVDYSVLQLRRMKEEMTNGLSKQESVSTSVRWAGQAVLTAGVTVIVAYVILAVANVPIFNDVGVSIAMGVSILLLASLTLVPSLELLLGERLFWPRLRVRKGPSRPGLLAKVSSATLKHKLAVALVITLLAGGAVAATASTSTGVDVLKLIPNFQSIQGLTVITQSLGSGSVSPGYLVITMPTPIVYGDDQFNQTLMNQLETISSRITSSEGVTSVVGPTRPYGSPFNYSSISEMPEPLRSQYLSGVMSQIGRDNRTALVTVGLLGFWGSSTSVNYFQKVESDVRSMSLLPGIVIDYGGSPQSAYDNQQFIGGLIPEVTIILCVAVYVILFFQLRSAFTPLRLLFTILCSVAFSLALLAIVFSYSLKLPILNYVPLFVIVTMLGVGIDYDIFYVTRIREEILSGKTDDEAIKTATSKVWVTVFGLGLILSSVFGSLFVTGIAILQEVSLVVSAAVLIDVSVVILLFVPSLMALAERFNWWPSKIGKGSRNEASTGDS
jgi:RND superfamily putative drug exporter